MVSICSGYLISQRVRVWEINEEITTKCPLIVMLLLLYHINTCWCYPTDCQLHHITKDLPNSAADSSGLECGATTS